MPTPTAQAFLDGLDALLADLKALDPHPNPLATQEIYRAYRALHREYRASPLKGLLQHATPDQKLMVRFLELGKENYDSFMQDLVVHIQPSAQATSTAVATFLKSAEAFRHLRAPRKSEAATGVGQDLEQEGVDRDAVRRILGSMLGVEVGDAFVLSIRGEMAGKVVAYALAGLCEDDLAAWEDPVVRKKWPSRDAYLLDCIRRHDTVMAYEIGEHDPGDSTYPIACVLFPEEDGERRRPSHQADSCMVNHRAKTIVFGAQTTSSEHDAGQAMSAVRMFSALERLVEQPTVGEPPTTNPYYGYTVTPFFLHAGYFPAERTQGRKAAGQAFLDILEAEGIALDGDDRQALARQAFFNVFSEGTPNPALAATWARFNIHVCGADTLQLFHDMQAALKEGPGSRRFSEIVLDGTTSALEVLAREGVGISSKSRGQNVMKPILDGILHTLENHALNFPVQADTRGIRVGLSQAERTMLSHAAAQLDRLREKIEANNPGDHRLMCRHMARLAAGIREGSYQQDFLDPDNQDRPRYAWSDSLHQKINGRMDPAQAAAHLSYLDALCLGMAQDFAARQVPAAMTEAVAMIQAQATPSCEQAFLDKLTEEALGYVEGTRRLRRIDRHEDPRAYQAFHQTFQKIRQHDGTASAHAVFAVGLRGLYNQGVFPALRKGPAEDTKDTQQLRHLALALVGMSEMPGGERLRSALNQVARQVYDAPPAAAPRRKIRA